MYHLKEKKVLFTYFFTFWVELIVWDVSKCSQNLIVYWDSSRNFQDCFLSYLGPIGNILTDSVRKSCGITFYANQQLVHITIMSEEVLTSFKSQFERDFKDDRWSIFKVKRFFCNVVIYYP